MNRARNYFLVWATVLSLASGCGGGGGGGGVASVAPAASTLGGVAAVGSPIVGASVNVVCAAGTVMTATTGNTGSWIVTMANQTLPCAVEVSNGTIGVGGAANATAYHSIATSPGTVNVTPLTDLLVANMAGTTSPSAWFTNISSVSAPLASFTQGIIAVALAQLRTALGNLTPLAGVNPITTPFTAAHGNSVDDMLDALRTALSSSSVSYATLLSNASQPTFTAPAGLGAALTTAYAGTVSGGSGSGSGSGGSGGGGSGGTAVGTQMGGSRQGVALNIAAGAGVVTTFAGSGVNAGTGFFPAPPDAIGTAAVFSQPTGLTTDGVNLYVADYNNARIRKVVISTGAVTTLAGMGGFGSVDGIGTAAGFQAPAGITTDGTNLYVVDQAAGNVRKIVIATGAVTTLAAVGGFPYGITTDGVNLYVSELTGNKIDMVVIATGVVSTFAGSGTFNIASADGTGTAATFQTPAGLTTDGTNVYVAEAGGGKIRKIVIATAVVTTLAGQNLAGTADGIGGAAQFHTPYGITCDGTNLYVADATNHSVRRVVIATAEVTTIAGSAANAGSADGIGAAASFSLNRAIVTDGVSVYVGDTSGHTIRKIQ